MNEIRESIKRGLQKCSWKKYLKGTLGNSAIGHAEFECRIKEERKEVLEIFNRIKRAAGIA